MSLLANRQPKAKARPVSGSCRWVLPIGECDTGVLAINGQQYTVTVLRGPNGIVGYRLGKDDGKTYDIDATAEVWKCDCPDATYRERACKHVKALQVALAAGGKQ
jgi:hypothetical protein